MTLRLPLFGKILGWFFLNLLLLALIAGWVVRSEFRLEALINGAGGERFQRVADTLLGELRERPRNTWDRTLERFSATYQVQFAIVDERGEVVAGAALTLPEEIKSRVRVGRGPGRPEGARGNGPQREEFRGAPPEGFRGPPPDIERRPAGGLPRSLLQTHGPDRFWVLFPAPQLEFGPRRLVAQAETLSAGGLLVDYRPLFWAAGAVLVVSVLWWLPFVHGITRSLRQMTLATEQISVGRFDTRVEGGRGDELGRLGLAIQSMAVRLEHHLTGQKRFLSDISHELCAPIARLQMALGILEQRADAAQQQQVADLREELDHMSALVNELLSFSKAGLKSRNLALGPVILRPMIERVLAREGVGEQEFRLDVDAQETVMAEPELLARALGNLVRNSLRYAGAAGPITVSTVRENGLIVLTIADEGPGVPPEALARLGEPFFRPDAARTREQGGTGLGLAIVKTCLEACQGTLTLRNRSPRGFAAEVRLRPANPA